MATPSDKADGESQDRSYLLFRRAASLRTFGALADDQSIASQLARSRGGGEQVPTEGLDDSVELSMDASEATVVALEEGKISLDVPYVVHFVSPSQRELHWMDVVGLPEASAYPVPNSLFASLPSWARSELEETGYLKCSGVYDHSEKALTDVVAGWKERSNTPADELARMLAAVDGDRLAGVVYLFLQEYGSEAYSTPEAIASLRDIQPASVETEIAAVSETLTGDDVATGYEEDDYDR